MSGETTYIMYPNQVADIVKECVENRAIIIVNGEFLGEFEPGRQMVIEPRWLKEYMHTIVEFIALNNFDELDLISVLYAIDQEIFTTGWEKIDKKFSNSCIKLINRCKFTLSEQLKYTPEDIEEMIIHTKKYRDQKQSIDSYIIQLLDEDVLTLECLENADFFKDLTRNELMTFCIDGKISTSLLTKINSIASLNNIQIRQLGDLRFFDELSYDEFNQLMKNGFLNTKGIIELQKGEIIERNDAVQLLGGIEEIARAYRRFVENKNKKDAKLYFELLNPAEVLILYVKGKMTRDDLNMKTVSKSDTYILTEEEFLMLAKKGFPKEVSFTSEELLAGYLSRYSRKTLIELANLGYIEPKKILDLADLKLAQTNRGREASNEDLLAFYNPKMIAALLEEETDIEFINKLNENLLSILGEKEKLEYINQLIEACKESMEDDKFLKTMINLIDNSQLPKEFFKQLDISQDALMDMVLEGELSDTTVIQYFNEGIFGDEELKTLYGNDYDAIIDLVKQKILDNRALKILPSQLLAESLVLEELTVQDVFSVYAKHNGISVHDLREIFEKYEDNTDQRINIVHLIGEEFDGNKIRELFIEDILTHSDVLELEEKGIITAEQSEEISQINRDKIYAEIFGKGITSEADIQEDEIKEPVLHGDGKYPDGYKTPMMSARKREEFFRNIAKSDFREVESKDKNGREAPFGGYTLIGYPEYGIVIFENFERTSNATYIMTLQELKSHVTTKDNGSAVFKKSKKALRKDINQGRAVRLCYHVPNWGHNVIEAMKELSKEAKEEISSRKQEKLADMMRKEFIKSRLQQKGGRDNPLIEMLVNARVETDKKKIKQAKVQALEAEAEVALEEENTREEAEGEEHGEE